MAGKQRRNTTSTKTLEELNLEEAALIAGLPPSPEPVQSLCQSRRRSPTPELRAQPHVGGGLHLGSGLQRAKDAPLNLRRRGSAGTLAPYFVEEVRRYLQEKYGSQRIYRGGLRVYTTLEHPHAEIGRKGTGQSAARPRQTAGFPPDQVQHPSRQRWTRLKTIVADDWIEPFQEGQMLYRRRDGSRQRDRRGPNRKLYGNARRQGHRVDEGKNPADILEIGDVTQFQIQP